MKNIKVCENRGISKSLSLLLFAALILFGSGASLFAEETTGAVVSGEKTGNVDGNRREEFKRRMDQNQDGKLDQFERRRAEEVMRRKFGKDADSNPPGAEGGPGTNWEKKPGPQGGAAGASPDIQGRREAFMRKMDQNQDGKLDDAERQKAQEVMKEKFGRDLDNNPPGMRGGPGTNWENKPGAQGGAGASPNYGGGAPRRDFDNNPPGMRGGPGTNWENRPGVQGGAGASPNYGGGAPRRDFDNNPPGMRGGPGTNWENRPGVQGGAGASPNYGGGAPRRDFDNNPPGMRGGPGTNWENRPGAQGGAGASPNYGGGAGARGFGGGAPGGAPVGGGRPQGELKK